MPEQVRKRHRPFRLFDTRAALLADNAPDGTKGYCEDKDEHWGRQAGVWAMEPKTVKVSLTATEIKALAASPKTLVAAQGADFVIQFLGALLQLNDDGTDYGDAAAQGNMLIKYVDGAGIAVSGSIEGNAFIDDTVEAFTTVVPVEVVTSTVAQSENTPLVLDNDGGEFTTGTRTLEVFVTYRVHDVS